MDIAPVVAGAGEVERPHERVKRDDAGCALGFGTEGEPAVPSADVEQALFGERREPQRTPLLLEHVCGFLARRDRPVREADRVPPVQTRLVESHAANPNGRMSQIAAAAPTCRSAAR